MSIQTDNLSSLLKPFGLEDEEIRIYLYLLEKSVATALNISRNLHIGRTKVYRLLDKLIDKQLVTQQCDSTGFKFIASNPSQLNILLMQKENQILALRESFPELLTNLKNRFGAAQLGSQILYYRGKNGLSQVNWNLLQAKNEFLSYEITNANAYLPRREAEKLRHRLVEKKIKTRTIINQKTIEAFTQVTEMVKSWWQIRYLPLSILRITADVFIYNDIYAVCHYLKDGDIFCFEMHNQELAQMQKELFENLWKQATKLKIINNQGKASVF